MLYSIPDLSLTMVEYFFLALGGWCMGEVMIRERNGLGSGLKVWGQLGRWIDR